MQYSKSSVDTPENEPFKVAPCFAAASIQIGLLDRAENDPSKLICSSVFSSPRFWNVYRVHSGPSRTACGRLARSGDPRTGGGSGAAAGWPNRAINARGSQKVPKDGIAISNIVGGLVLGGGGRPAVSKPIFAAEFSVCRIFKVYKTCTLKSFYEFVVFPGVCTWDSNFYTLGIQSRNDE